MKVERKVAEQIAEEIAILKNNAKRPPRAPRDQFVEIDRAEYCSFCRALMVIGLDGIKHEYDFGLSKYTFDVEAASIQEQDENKKGK